MEWSDIEIQGQVFANGYEEDLTHNDLVQVIFKHVSNEDIKNGEVPFDVKHTGSQDKDQIRHCETFWGLIAGLAWMLACMFPIDLPRHTTILRALCASILPIKPARRSKYESRSAVWEEIFG